MKSTIVFPDHLHVDAQGPMGNFTVVISPKRIVHVGVWHGGAGMPESQKTDTSCN